MDAFKDIIQKVPEVTKSLKELSENDDFKKHLGQAGAIGGLCVIGLDIANKLRDDLKTPERQAFASVLKIVFESAKEALPKSNEINLGDIKTEDLLKDL